jgi:hypothetical protein
LSDLPANSDNWFIASTILSAEEEAELRAEIRLRHAVSATTTNVLVNEMTGKIADIIPETQPQKTGQN